MLETNADQSRRYTPPPQRNRSLNRRKSGDKFEKVNFSVGNEGEKIQPPPSRTFHTVDYAENGNNNVQNENIHPRLIPMDGCCSSEAAHLLSNRWRAATQSCNDPSVDIAERPVLYSGVSGSSWGHVKVAHQMDFQVELRHSIQNASSNTVSNAGNRY